ncbi:hypothetical protein [Isoptericola sp. NPDC056605]|uniref:hypothetical protein n=1 Tax=Isoptericola sp. NPDC056605 TaxID=3345876 RepID=UPI0036A20215
MTSAVVGTLALGGVAYAAIVQEPTGVVSCRPDGGSETNGALSTPLATGDPIADCANALEDAGNPDIKNPVAYQDGSLIVVVPSNLVPDGVTPIDSRYVVRPEVRELESSLQDWVDGGYVCRDVDEQRAWAEGELKRLGLDDWSVVRAPDSVNDSSKPCALITDETKGVLQIRAAEDQHSIVFEDGEWPLSDDLHAAFKGDCLSLDEAGKLADELISKYYEETWPTTLVPDETSSCARVDATIGGDVQVIVYGPTKS